MKKILLSTAAAAAVFSGAAFAADLPSRKAAPIAPAAPLWTGVYAGLNAGYNWGTNNNAASYALGGQEGATGIGTSIAVPYGVALSNSSISNTQSGFIGGGQFGYNYQGFLSQQLVLGLETDIQGSGIRGSGRKAGIFSVTDGDTTTATAAGGTQVQTGVDYIGTVRGRVGYLWTPTLLAYGTAGFAYGGAWANVGQTANGTISNSATTVAFGQSLAGGAQSNQLLTGWAAGGGLEWMFLPNWSLKAEALYWNLGNMNVNTVATGLAPFSGSGVQIITAGSIGTLPAVVTGQTQVNFQGVTARAGVNYHFNWGTAPVVAAF